MDKKTDYEKEKQNNRAIISLLELALSDQILDKVLEDAIKIIFSPNWLKFESKGAIFLVEDEPEVLLLKAEIGLAKPLLEICSIVPFGRCLCGKAALSKKLFFSNGVDDDHENKFEGIKDHGHYCVPIIYGDNVIGILNLYVEADHPHDDNEVDFLVSVTKILAGIIHRKRQENTINAYAEELKEANNLKDLFIDIVRHDLINPVTTLKNSITVLLKREPDEMRIELLNQCLISTEKLIEMIENSSELAKLTEKRQIGFKTHDLNKIIQESLRIQNTQLNEAGIEVVNLAKGEYPALVNPIIGNVFTNYISNAVKYASSGKKIEVNIQDNGTDWIFYMKDWGPGVPDEYKTRIFARFQQLRRTGIKGSGLGLAIVSRITEIHEGKAWVEDNPEGGSIFYLSIPKEKSLSAS